MKHQCGDCGYKLTKEEFEIWETSFPNSFNCSCAEARTIVSLRRKIKKLKSKIKEVKKEIKDEKKN